MTKLHTQKKPSFEQILDMYYNYLFKFTLKQVNDIELAKDLTQDVFVKAHDNYSKYDPDKSSIKTWLFKIANNHIINYWKSAYHNTKSYQEINHELILGDEDILASIIQKEDVAVIMGLMKECLNKRNTKIMNLYFFSQLPTEEIADTLSMNQKTVSNIISLSIKKLKEKLEGYLNG